MKRTDFDPSKEWTPEQTDGTLLRRVVQEAEAEGFNITDGVQAGDEIRWLAKFLNVVSQDCNGEPIFELLHRALHRKVED